MLDAHLNPDIDAASRNHDFIDYSVKWLSSFIPTDKKILDLGCGPGLYAKQLADAGYDVTGIDFSKRSIEYARNQDQQSTYIYQNYLELDYADTFDAVILVYCDYGALTPDERKILQGKIHKALKPGGLFILDVFTDKYLSNKFNGASWELCEDGGYWSPNPYFCLTATHLYENGATALDQYVVVTDDNSSEYLVWNTGFTAERLVEEMSMLELVGTYDDVCGGPYTGEAETLCAVFEK
jgi:SAM-dependent methyltransferase